MKRELLLNEYAELKSGTLGEYYFDFSRILNPRWQSDEDGVRLRPYPPPLFDQYHPMAIGEYALDMHRLYLRTGEDRYKIAFLSNADWFVKNQVVVDGKYGFWYYKFNDARRYNRANPFSPSSSMSQGYGISLLLRAYQLTNDEKYIHPGIFALNSYDVPVEEGGFRVLYKNQVFFEEAPSYPPSLILNGFIFSILGLYDYYRFDGNLKAKALFGEGLQTLEAIIPHYDLGYWSRYNLQYDKYLTSQYYHNIHIIQLALLWKITDKEIFDRYSRKWDGYRNDKVCLARYYINFHYYRYKYKLDRIRFLLETL